MSDPIRDEKLYGLDGQEKLDDEIEDVVELVFEDACEVSGESFDVIADRIEWPIRVGVYRRMKLPKPERFAQRIVEDLLDRLDEEYGDPDGNTTMFTPAMIEAATAFAKVVLDAYKPWTCEPTGEVVEVSREEARKMNE